MATVLVTGASGYIGRFLVKELLEKGEAVFVNCRPGWKPTVWQAAECRR